MGTEIRTLRDADEIGPWLDAVSMGFLRPERRGHIPERHPLEQQFDRAWAAFDGTRVVGTLRAFEKQVTVPGGVLTTCGISGVSVLPGYRRQGLLGRMITNELAAARERGDAVSSLIAAGWPIYGRFGYGAATETAEYRVDARFAALTAAATAGADAAGAVEFVDAATYRAEAPAVYDRMRLRTVGAVDRPDRFWDQQAGLLLEPDEKAEGRVFALLRDDAGAVRGYLHYRVADAQWRDGRADAELNVVDLIADDGHGEAALWRHVWEHDWVTSVTIGFRAVDEPLRWQLRDGRSIRQTVRSDFMWVLLLDVAAALSGRAYPAEGALTFRVVPPAGARDGYALDPARTYRLDAAPEGARCHATTAEPELTLPLDALGSLYLGGASASELARAGLVRGAAADVLARADLLFSTSAAPWCNTIF